jgi:hypothetical protein
MYSNHGWAADDSSKNPFKPFEDVRPKAKEKEKTPCPKKDNRNNFDDDHEQEFRIAYDDWGDK